jgi:gamma-glutamyltranspeptidase/glutathione hydrolase
VLLQELAMTGLLDLRGWQSPSVELAHHMVEIKKLAFEDRERYAADPRVFAPLPPELLSEAYARRRFALVDAGRARAQVTADMAADGDTTYLAAMDGDGNVASMTTSINGAFGSGYVAGDTGILLNNRMTYWHLDPEHPNALAPGKRVRHTVSPAIALEDGAPVMSIGTPGADGQVQTIYQVLVNIVDFGMNLQQAVEQPRWRSFVDGQDANWPHRSANELRVEGRMPAAVIEGLQAHGHTVVRDLPWSGGVGSVQVIGRDPRTGVLSVGSDPRRDAYGMAY